MQFAAPWALVGLLLIPLLMWRQQRARGRGSGAVGFSDLSSLPASGTGARALVAAALPWLRLLALALLVVALARPQTQDVVEKQKGQGIDIMLTMDISGSMAAEDFEPKNRFEVARDTLARFATESDNDRLGLVIFARQAFTQCPLTLDHEMVVQLLGQVQQGMIKDGTAIGMAIATAAHRLQDAKSKSRVIILMTDGMNNCGKIDPLTAARAAAALGIRIYAVGVGKQGGAPVPIYDPVLGKRYMTNPDGSLALTEIDEETLKKVAQIGGGKYFRATDSQALGQIYSDIRRMAKGEYELTARRPVVEEFARCLWPAVLLLALAFTLGATYARKAP